MNLARNFFGFAQFILVVFVLTFSAHAAGEVDASFLASLSGAASGRVNKIIVQPDGKALVGGNFRTAGILPRAGLFRLNTDGTVDASFQPPSFYNLSGTGGSISAIDLQSDGKILVGGDFQGANSIQKQGIMRLNSNGSIDATFNVLLNSGGTISDIIVLPDDRILLGGNFTINDTGGNRIGVARLNSNGSLDSIVYQNIVALNKILLLPDGKLLTGNLNSVRRFNVDGTFDPGFSTIATSSSVLDMQLLADGKILVAGNFNTVNGFNLRALFRINPDGSVDTTYNPGGSNPNPSVNGITPLPNGKFLIFGPFSGYNGMAANKVALIDANGMLDTSFNMAANNFNPIQDIAVLPDGKILVGGVSTLTSQNALIRVNSNGTLDAALNVLISNSSGSGYTVLIQPDGKILVGGQFAAANGAIRGSLVRFNADGSLDTTFTPPNLPISWGVFGLELQADGKILVPVWVGSSGFTYRLNVNGTIETTISNTPYSRDAKYLPDEKILIATGDRVRRYNSNGTSDGTFSSPLTNGSDQIYKLAVQPDGKIIVVGTFTTIGGQTRGRIARLNADGSLDATFNPPGGANANIHTAVIQSDGKILIGGAFTGVNFDLNKQYLARLNPDASLDASFAPVLNAPVLGLKLQADGKILIAGAMSTVNGVFTPGIARINANGTLDTMFNVGLGTDSTVWSIDQQSDGKIVYVGQFSKTNGFSTLGIGRLLNTSVPRSTLFDYDGDGKADVSVFRPSENKWYILRSSDGQIVERIFAVSGDVPTPADFDGDGKTDIAIFRPATGDWWYLSSINNAQIFAHWGANGDILRPGDFDGDGRADYVVFRPTENNWFRLSSANGATSNRNFGIAGDKPVVGDFDGDGKSDVAIYRPSTGDWWWQSSVDNIQRATRWGIATDIPTPADFDGDGKTDFAVYRATTGVWYIINSSNGSVTIMNFGIAEDKPVPADYDGDGKADIAVFRPSTGIWYLMRSTAGFTALQFGVSTDIPTQNSFVP